MLSPCWGLDAASTLKVECCPHVDGWILSPSWRLDAAMPGGLTRPQSDPSLHVSLSSAQHDPIFSVLPGVSVVWHARTPTPTAQMAGCSCGLITLTARWKGWKVSVRYRRRVQARSRGGRWCWTLELAQKRSRAGRWSWAWELDFFRFSCFPKAELRTLSLWLGSA